VARKQLLTSRRVPGTPALKQVRIFVHAASYDHRAREWSAIQPTRPDSCDNPVPEDLS
jgi:hypothetical protein